MRILLKRYRNPFLYDKKDKYFKAEDMKIKFLPFSRHGCMSAENLWNNLKKLHSRKRSNTLFFLYKNLVYKNVEAEIWVKIKNNNEHFPASTPRTNFVFVDPNEIKVFCFFDMSVVE